MTKDYYDLDDILADAEKIPCRFNITVPGLGYLEGNPGKAIQKDTKVELAMWLAQVLAISGILEDSETSFVDLSEPDFMNYKVLNAIKTDPVHLDLHSISPNYFKLIEKWSTLFNDKSTIAIAMKMLKERAFEINNFANNSNRKFNNNFTYSLDEFEKEIYKITAESNKRMRKWMKY